MPLINGALSWRGSSNQKRRAPATSLFLSSLDQGRGRRCRSEGFREGVRHAAEETFLVTRLVFILLRYLGVGYKWFTRFLALGCYAFFLFPGFIQVGYYYFFSKQIHRDIVYDDQPRNNEGQKPAVAFVTGGAWIIGYKAWGSLLGIQLSQRDIIVACIDDRNFPQATISNMIKDALEGISFVCNHIAEYGGDPNRIYLMRQSAGAHISTCAFLDQAVKESGEKDSRSWSMSQIQAYFGLSGGYNLFNLVDYFHNQGLYRLMFLSIMEGEESLDLSYHLSSSFTVLEIIPFHQMPARVSQTLFKRLE